MFKKKIKPTKEMIEQSNLWNDAKEDLELVKALYIEIIAKAKKLGFTGICDIDDAVDESICYVYDSEEHKELCCLGKDDDYECVGHPLALITVLENKINKSKYKGFFAAR